MIGVEAAEPEDEEEDDDDEGDDVTDEIYDEDGVVVSAVAGTTADKPAKAKELASEFTVDVSSLDKAIQALIEMHGPKEVTLNALTLDTAIEALIATIGTLPLQDGTLPVQDGPQEALDY